MKKTLLLIFTLFLFVNTSLAQNWQPFNKLDISHYAVQDSSFITNTIKVDSIGLDGIDSVYFFNMVIDTCDTCSSIKTLFTDKAPQFLGSLMKFDNDGNYYFYGKDSFLIKSNAQLGESWMFDNSKSITAEVTNVFEELVLEEKDSIKYINLSDSRIIKLSKNYGLIQFPFNSKNRSYQLVGEQHSKRGAVLPEFKDYYDYSVGDVFEYKHYYESPMSEDIELPGMIIQKEILEVILKNSDTAWYKVKTSILHFVSVGYFFGSTTYYREGETKIEDWIIYKEHPFSGQIDYLPTSNISEYYPNELFGIAKYNLADNWNYEYNSPKYNNGLGRVKFTIVEDKIRVFAGNIWESNGFRTNYSYYQRKDSLFEYGYSDSYLVVEEGVGLIEFVERDFEGFMGIVLQGYIKNGVKVGTVSSEDFFTNVSDINSNNLNIYPNPATNQITLSLSKISSNTNVQVFNSSAQVVMEQNHDFTDGNLVLDVDNLPTGIYYVKVNTPDGVLNKKLIIQ